MTRAFFRLLIIFAACLSHFYVFGISVLSGNMWYDCNDIHAYTGIVTGSMYGGPKGDYRIAATITPPGSSSTYTIVEIKSGAFDGCKSMTAVKVPKTIKLIGKTPFGNCVLLEEITVDEANPSYTAEENILYTKDRTELIRYAPNKPRKNFEIPDHVSLIWDGAFENCTYLSSIVIPNTITTIPSEAFHNSKSLEIITLPQSLITIKPLAFWGCSSLTSVDIPLSVTTIGSHSFWACTSLTSINIPQTVTDIGEGAFMDCSSLISAEWPSTLNTIGSYMFSNCKSLQSIVIPSSVISIGHSAFRQCEAIENISLPYGLISIGESCFSGCSNLTSIEIPSSVTSIGYAAFYNCTSLTEIDLPPTLSILDASAFKECTSLKSLKIPGSISKLNDMLCYGCSSLESVDIPSTVTAIGEQAFANCRNLTSVYYNTHTPPECKENVFTGETYENATLYVPVGAKEEFENLGCWWNFKNIVEYVFPEIEAEKVTISQREAELKVGQTLSLTATVFPENATNRDISWISDNEEVCAIDHHGKVTAVAAGNAIIVAKSGNVSDSCRIVVNDILAESLEVYPYHIDVVKKENFIVRAEIFPENATCRKVRWYSTDESVAVVTGTGDLTGSVSIENPGICHIVASTVDGTNIESFCEVEFWSAGVEAPYIEDELPFDIYGIDGRLIMSNCNEEDLRQFNGNIFIIKQGNKYIKYFGVTGL